MVPMVPPWFQKKRIRCFPWLLLRMRRGSWMVPMVPDDLMVGIADDLQTCIHNAVGFVCDGVQTAILSWESMHIWQLTI